MAVTGGLGALFGGAAIPQRWTSGGASLTMVQRQSLVMGSIISFQAVAETEVAGYDAIRKALDAFRALENIFSMYDEHSEMAKLAKAAGKHSVVVSAEAHQLLTFAKEMYKNTDNRFDITIEPAMKRWGFRNNPGEAIIPPTDKERRKLERLIGSDKIHIEPNKIGLAEHGMAIDTGGIAGGFALDRAIEVMKKCDIAAAFINFSGDLHCFGQPVEGEYWPVYIWDTQTRQPLADPVELNDEALSTSGAYQNRRHNNAHDSWGHLMLPGKAEPVEPVSSVTTIHSSAMVADAWSTASYVGAKAPKDLRLITLKNK